MRKDQLLQTLLSLTLGLFLLSACPEENMPPPESQKHMLCCWEDVFKVAQSEGLNYVQSIEAGLKGEAEAVKKLLLLSAALDLDASFGHGAVLVELLNKLGDQAMAKHIQGLDEQLNSDHKIHQESLKDTLRNTFEGGFAFHQDKTIQAKDLSQFPKTAEILGYQAISEPEPTGG